MGANSGKQAGVRASVRRLAVRVLPRSVVDRIRRRRATKQYLKALGYELVERETRLEYLEGRVAARRDGFYERIVRDVLERTELVLQELDRRIEGLSARSGERLNAVEEQLVQLREELGRLRRLSDEELGRLGPVDQPQEPAGLRPEEAEPAAAPAADPERSASGNGRIAEPEHAATTAE
jgi:hypothetical protein